MANDTKDPRTSETVNNPSEDWLHLERRREACRDLMRGWEWMTENSARANKYLPKNPAETKVRLDGGEEIDPWAIRVSESRIFNVFQDVVIDSAGKLFAKAPKMADETPPKVQSFWDDVDGNGTAGDVFLLACVLRAIAEGVHGVLCEYPRYNENLGERSEAEEESAPGRRAPLLRRYGSEDIIGWSFRPRVEGEVPVLAHVRLRERGVEMGAEPWDVIRVPQVRVLYAGDPSLPEENPERWVRWEVWREKKLQNRDLPVWVVHESGVMRPQVDIPFVDFCVDGVSPFAGIPPYLNIKNLVLAHFRKVSLLDSGQKIVGFPFLHRAGAKYDMTKKKWVGMGPDRVINDENPMAKAEFVEPKGTAWESMQKAIDKIEDNLRTLADDANLDRMPGNVTATGDAIRSAGSTLKLESWAASFEDSIDRVLRFCAIYLGAVTVNDTKGWGKVELNRQFSPPVVQKERHEERRYLKKEGGLSLQSLFDIDKAEGTLPETMDWEVEQKRVAEERAEGEAETEARVKAGLDLLASQGFAIERGGGGGAAPGGESNDGGDGSGDDDGES